MVKVEARVFAPLVVTPGTRIQGEVEVAPIAGEVPITRITVIADRASYWRAPAMHDRYRKIQDGAEVAIRTGTRPLTFFGQYGQQEELWRRSFEPGVLATAHRFPIDFIIPTNTVVSHASVVGFDTLTALVRVTTHVIGPHLAETYVQPITVVVSDAAAGVPATARSAVGDLEIGIASTTVARGTQIVGTVAGASAITVDLVASVRVVNPPNLPLNDLSYVYDHSYSCRRVRVELPTEDRGTPFALEVPPDLCPTVDAPTHRVRWSVRASSREWMDSCNASIPIEIVVGDVTASTAAPTVGTSNVEPVFADHATAHDWKLETGIDARDPRLGLLLPAIAREEGDQHLVVAYAYRGAETYLVSRLAYPSLELGLDVVPSSRLRELFSHDLQSGVTAWDRHYHADARVREPAEALLRAIVPQLPEALGAIVHWTDDELVCEVPISILTSGELGKVADALHMLADRLAASRPAAPPTDPYR